MKKITVRDGRLVWIDFTEANDVRCPVVSFDSKENEVFALVKEYKYRSVRSLARPLAEFLALVCEGLGIEVDEKIVVVALPTIARHIRERGFDHMAEVAKYLAEIKGWKYSALLVRRRDSVQVGADAAQRRKQAKLAYAVSGEVDEDASYLLLDDVWTTGSSMLAAIHELREAGAKKIYGAVICRP